jgi:pilus assembly protein TadC
MRIYEIIFRAMPEGYREWMKKYINYSDFIISPAKYSGFSIIYGILLGISIAFIVYLFNLNLLGLTTVRLMIIFGLTSFLVFEAFMHAMLIVVSDRIADFVDDILPDALRLISANIRSGFTPDKALLLSARPEFGPLEKQIVKTAKLTFSGEPLEEAIQTMPKNINSSAIKRSIDLLVEGMQRGGNIANLLDGLSDDIRQTKILKKEVQAIVMMYAIFIFFAAGIGAPLLYGISTFLVETMKQIGGMTNVAASIPGTKLISFTGIKVETQFLMLYTISAIGVTSIFGGLIMGIIQGGSERAGLKFIPILFIISITMFFLVRTFVTGMFGIIS